MIRRMKDFPRQLQIKDNLWEIKFCRRIPDEPETTLGLCDPSETTIYIKLGQTPVERFKTLLHELGHATCFEYGIKENHAAIYNLEEPILRLLMDNGLVL